MKEILEKLSGLKDLTEQEALQTMTSIMDGEATPNQIAGFLMGLKIKGETTTEISAFVRAMLSRANTIVGPRGVIDTCGTGGDASSTFNISTAAALVTAAAGVPVAKHGNRSVTSKCGSADVFKEMGFNIEMPPQLAEQCLAQTGIAFLFAPLYHPSMKHAVIPRREMGIRTVFNILGPLANPAGVKKQVIGAFNLDAAEKMIAVLKALGSEHALVLHSRDGLDEISLGAVTDAFELKNGEINRLEISPQELGLATQPISSIKGGDAVENAGMVRDILSGKQGATTDITALNAGAAIYVAGAADSIKSGIDMAFDAIRSGKAKAKLEQLIDFSASVKPN